MAGSRWLGAHREAALALDAGTEALAYAQNRRTHAGSLRSEVGAASGGVRPARGELPKGSWACCKFTF